MIIQRSGFDALINDDADFSVGSLEALELNHQLELINQIVQNTFQHQLFHNQALYYPQLDAQLLKLSQRLYEGISVPSLDNELHLIIGSDFFEIGGHSRVARDLTALSARAVVVVTDIFQLNEKSTHKQASAIRFFAPVPVIFIPPGNLQSKLEYLCQLIQVLAPGYVTCVNHHQDPIPIVATAAAPVRGKIFHHHGDYNPSLGASLSNYIHLDCCGNVESICQRHMTAERVTMLGLHDASMTESSPQFRSDRQLNTVTSGGMHKYLFNPGDPSNDYPSVVRCLLQAGAGAHHHLGPLAEPHVQLIQQALTMAGIDLSRFVYHGPVPSLSAVIPNIENPIFIPSFPIPGGLTLVEMMGAGMPIFINSSQWTTHADLDITVKSLQSLMPQQFVAWSSTEELPLRLAELKRDYAACSQASMARFGAHHSKVAFEHQLARIRSLVASVT